MMAAPPLVMTTRARYHVVSERGVAVCDDEIVLNLLHEQEWATVPAGLRCTAPACRRAAGEVTVR